MKGLMENYMAYQLIKSQDEEEYENDGCLTLAVPAIGIFLIFMVLDRLGFAPGEVWGFIKMVFFPSTWDKQLGLDYSHFVRAGLLILSAVALFIAVIVVLFFNTLLSDFFKRFDNFVMRIFYMFFRGMEKLLVAYFVINLMVMVFIFLWHVVAGFFVWLNG